MGKKKRPEVLREKGGSQRGQKAMDCATYRSEIVDKNIPLMDGRHNDRINGFGTLVRQCGLCGKGVKNFHTEHARKLCAYVHGVLLRRRRCLKLVCQGCAGTAEKFNDWWRNRGPVQKSMDFWKPIFQKSESRRKGLM